jgi:dinuclear metal center YbgI/SA1388 family protein
MKIAKIYNILNEISPFKLQENWDNSGLNVGSFNKKIKKIYISLDIDKKLLETIEKNSLLITHHPLIFSPLKSINIDDYPSNLIQIAIKKNISIISMHTNFDKTHLNQYVFENILNFKITSKDEFVIYGEFNGKSFNKIYTHICKILGLINPNFVKCKTDIKSIALTTGSGASMIKYMKNVDCFLTGDIKYHDAMYAKSIGLSMIDISHFESEKYFAQLLKKNLKNISIPAIILNSENPFG